MSDPLRRRLAEKLEEPLGVRRAPLRLPRLDPGRARWIRPEDRAHHLQQRRRVAGTAVICGDLKKEPGQPILSPQVGLVVGTKLLAYHCTRLLDYELEFVREGGLRPLSRELVETRIASALAGGWLSEADAEELQRSHTFARGDERFRENQVCLIAGRQIFDDPDGGVHGCLPLLSTWGGEGIYMGLVDTQMEARLGELGRPTVVAAAIDPAASFTAHPTLGKLFIGIELGLDIAWADVFYRAPIPPVDVLGLWQPGSSDYDRHPQLPRA